MYLRNVIKYGLCITCIKGPDQAWMDTLGPDTMLSNTPTVNYNQYFKILGKSLTTHYQALHLEAIIKQFHDEYKAETNIKQKFKSDLTRNIYFTKMNQSF